MLIVITGKTASGKDTVISNIYLKFPQFKKVLTATSRALRPGEKEGIDYIFLSEEEFRKKIEDQKFLEYVQYGGNLYGTQKSQFEGNRSKDLLWKIDPSRAGQVRKLLQDTRLVVIYINTDDQTILERLKKRGLSNEEMEKRMQDDKDIWQQYRNNYDFVIENIPGSLDETVSKVRKIIEAQK